MKTATTSTILRIELSPDSRAMPLLMPIYAEIPVTTAKAPITISHMTGPDSMPVKDVTPELNCMAANPNDVANPRTVAIIASNSTTTPAGRWVFFGRISTVASRKVSVLPRLWWEYARHSATTQYMAHAVR